MIDFYLKKGYTLEWIEGDIFNNAIYKEWSCMTSSEYKAYKNIRYEKTTKMAAISKIIH